MPSDKRKALKSYSSFWVSSPVRTEVTTQPEVKEDLVGAEVALSNLLCCLSSGDYLRGIRKCPVANSKTSTNPDITI